MVTKDAHLNGLFVSYGDTPTRIYDAVTSKFVYWWPAVFCEDGQIYFRGATSANGTIRPDNSQYIHTSGSLLGADRDSVTITAPREIRLEVESDHNSLDFSLHRTSPNQGSPATCHASLSSESVLIMGDYLSFHYLKNLYISNDQHIGGYGFTGTKNGCSFIHGVCVG